MLFRSEGHSNEELARLLTDKTLDLVLLPDPPASTDYKADKIGELTLVLATTRKIRQSEALAENYVYVDWGTAFANWHASKFGEHVAPTLHVNLASIALSKLLASGGSAFLPRSLVEAEPSLQRVSGSPSFRRPVFACYREGNDRIDIIRQVVDRLQGTLI